MSILDVKIVENHWNVLPMSLSPLLCIQQTGLG